MADAPLMVVDGAGVVTGWSRAAERRFGPATADALGQRLMDVLANDTRRVRRGDEMPPGLRLEPLAGEGWAVWSTGASAGSGTGGDVVEAALLDVMFTQARVRVHVLDPELRILRISDPYTDPDPAETERLRGRPFHEVCAFDEPDRVESFVREVLRTGVPGIERLFRTAAGDVPGGHRALSMTAFRLQEGHGARQSEDGRVLGVAVSMVDVSAQIRHRGRDAALAAVRDTVGRTLDVDATCRDLVEALVPGYADVGVVEVVDDVLRGETPEPGPLDLDVPLRRAAYGGSNPAAHPVGDVRAVVPGTPYQRALSDMRVRVLPLADATWTDADAARAGAIRNFGAHTLLVAPLTVRGAVLGLVSLYRCGDSEPFDEGDVPVVAAMASRAALGIDNARRYVHEYTTCLLDVYKRQEGTPATGSTRSPCPVPVRPSPSGRWPSAASTRPPPWGSCAPSSTPSPPWTWSPTSSSRACTTRRRDWPRNAHSCRGATPSTRSRWPRAAPTRCTTRSPRRAPSPPRATPPPSSSNRTAPPSWSVCPWDRRWGRRSGPPWRRYPSSSGRAACSCSTAARCGATPSPPRAPCARRSCRRTGRCGTCATPSRAPCPTSPSSGAPPCCWPGRTPCPRTATPPGNCPTTRPHRPPPAASRPGRWRTGTWRATPVTRPS